MFVELATPFVITGTVRYKRNLGLFLSNNKLFLFFECFRIGLSKRIFIMTEYLICF